jgi:hypothetical protein
VTACTRNWNDAIGVESSADGGTRWVELVPPTTVCTPGGSRPYDSSGFDPLLAYAPPDEAHEQGTVLLAATATTKPSVMGAATRSPVIIDRSPDGGLTWSSPQELEAVTAPLYVETTGSLAADPTRPGHA